MQFSARLGSWVVASSVIAGCWADRTASDGDETITASHAELVVTNTPLVPSVDAAGRRFGVSLAASDDGRVVVVGAPEDSAVLASAGAAHVFVRSGVTYTEASVLRPVALGDNDQFGSHVAVSADGSRIAVGAPYAGSADSGAVFVFVDMAGAWNLEATLTPTTASSGDEISPVAFDRTGTTLLVGAPNANLPACLGCGAAFVFTRDGGGGWSERATLASPSPAPFEKLGHAVALSRDGRRAVVGVPREDTVQSDAGGARTFVLESGGTWAHEALLTHLDALPNDLCGLSLATNALGDQVAIGCPLDDTSAGANAGTIRVFTLTSGAWSPDTVIAGRDAAAGDQLGYSVAMTSDGLRLVSGAIGDAVDPSVVGTGSVRTFDRVGARWPEGGIASISPLDEDTLGRAIAIADDGVLVLVSADLADGVAGGAVGAAWALSTSAERGEPCARDSYCATGACVDGVCCESACGGALDDCAACSNTLTGLPDGTCGPLSTAAAAATVCRAASDVCDTEERCVAGDATCPADGFLATTTECRASRGGCDVAERCTGAAATCPEDAVAGAGEVCRVAIGPCDAPEICDGSGIGCPMDRPAAEGAACGDGNLCNGEERCTLGACVVAALDDCDDDDVCTADACDAAMGCSHTEIAGCCRVDADCLDTDSCTSDLCEVATGACTHEVIDACLPHDAGPLASTDGGLGIDDAGRVDAALDPSTDAGPLGDAGADAGLLPPNEGCGCRAQTRQSGWPQLVAFFLLLGLGASRTRRALGSAGRSR